MNLQQRLQSVKIRKNLQKKKQGMIKNKIKAKEREKVNLDSSHFKTGKIQKTKIIQKKKFNTFVQKSRAIPIQIQDNANPGTYISESSAYLTTLERTKNYIKFDQQILQKGCQAILAYAESKKQKFITLQIEMKNSIQCNQCPILLRMAQLNNANQASIVITSQIEQMSKKIPQSAQITVLSPKQFIDKFKNDKIFKKSITKDLSRILVEFKIFKKSKICQKLLRQNYPIFPIDINKVPFSISDSIKSYQQYLTLLNNSCYTIAKTGRQHRVRLLIPKSPKALISNIQYVIYQLVARLIYKNKNKTGDNKLLVAKVKTNTSIPIDIYNTTQ